MHSNWQIEVEIIELREVLHIAWKLIMRTVH